MIDRTSTRRGFTMIEIAIASIVMVLLGLPVISLIMTGTQEAIVSEDYMEAEVLASRAIGELLAQEYGALEERLPLEDSAWALVDPTAPIESAVTFGSGKPESDAAYVMTVTAREQLPGLAVLEATVTWQHRNQTRSFSLLRLRARENLSAGGRVR